MVIINTVSFDKILSLSMGNPGAATCIAEMDARSASIIIPKLEELGIRGTDIYILWSDLSNKDYQIMAHYCKTVPSEVLIDAASRQDYSGRELLNEYALELRDDEVAGHEHDAERYEE